MNETIKFMKFFLIIVLMASVVMNGCKKDEDESDPPDLPPETALLMDFSTFNEYPGTKKSVDTYQNFAQAYLTVLYWDVLAIFAVAVPSVAYAEAFNHDPVYKGDNSWEWAYTITANQVEYSARLVSKRISNDEFTLKFYVTTSAPIYTQVGLITLEDFLWFDGTVMYDGTEAVWNLYEVGTYVALLEIGWEKDWENDTWVMKYEIIKPGHEELGSYIEQGQIDNSDFNAYLTVSYSSQLTNIEWETTNISGRIKAPHSFGDSDWHCWDESKLDVDCQ